MYYYIINLVCFYIGKFFGGYDELSIHWNAIDYTVSGKGLDGLNQIYIYLHYCDYMDETVRIAALVGAVLYAILWFGVGGYEGYTGKEIEEA